MIEHAGDLRECSSLINVALSDRRSATRRCFSLALGLLKGYAFYTPSDAPLHNFPSPTDHREAGRFESHREHERETREPEIGMFREKAKAPRPATRAQKDTRATGVFFCWGVSATVQMTVELKL